MPAAAPDGAALRRVASGRPGPAELVTSAASLRRVLARRPACLAALALADGVQRVRVDGVLLDLTDRGHRALWLMALHRLRDHP